MDGDEDVQYSATAYRGEQQGESSPWRTPGARFSVILNILGGLFFGYTIGFVPIMFQYNTYFADCSRYTAADTCNELTDAGCVWVVDAHSGAGACAFPDHATLNCSAFTSQDSCKAESNCYWRYHKLECDHRTGWDSEKQGVLAGLQIVGAMASSPVAGPLTNRIGRKWSIAASAVMGLMATAVIAIGWSQKQNFGALAFAEFAVGFVDGWLSVICPMYCGEMAARSLEETIGVLYQVACTFGIFCAGATGVALNPSLNATNIQPRIQHMLILQWVAAFLLLPVAALMPESTLWLQERKERIANKLLGDDLARSSSKASASDAGGPDSPGKVEPKTNIFKLQYLTPLLVGVALASGQQLTGINAIMIYGPQLVGAIGFKPLVGNVLIGTWNFLTCLMSIPLVRRYPPRVLYIVSTACATVACVLTGIAVCPGIFEADGTAQHVLSGLGVAAFVASFEFGIGPCFYVLAQDTFPAEVRSAGCSYTIWVQFVFNVVINWGFPIAKTALSGGPSGDQNLGMSICFFIFGGTGFLTALFLVLRMPKSNSEMRRMELYD